jgi:serine/threonine protein kinase
MLGSGASERSSLMLVGATSANEIISIPRKAGPYVGDRIVSCGSTSIVIKWHTQITGQTVALKVVNVNPQYPSQVQIDTRKEVSILAQMLHPNIVRIHGVTNDPAQVVIAMNTAGNHSSTGWEAENSTPRLP